MASPGQFRYCPLQHSNDIRLLRLKPGDLHSNIQISIRHEHLNERLRYEALSYTWGDPTKKKSISCNEAGDTLSVTRNCNAALRRLRRVNGERTLWIDAICIYSDRSSIKHCRNLRLGPQFYEVFDSAHLYISELLGSHVEVMRGHVLVHNLARLTT
ncbi:hypothetical protein K432DRAFT_14361 [Lepidopterella palustris CBS 459.81]|uniref:Heterokaryon incompatibility domain-containing protein n=1 Tax=Lepidopterella palustris CBS 459.81 TaxID=1314670 RepID=A0A8E2ED79_9PEZI|nr:hypothetical protein K432DRAFT_14361 [Lepidopterella palustris CBS 459.81]